MDEVRLGHAIMGCGISDETKSNYNYVANAVEYKLPLSDKEIKEKIKNLIKDVISPYV
ncbi:MAG: hypothetical protein WCI00_09485 [bacterium]